MGVGFPKYGHFLGHKYSIEEKVIQPASAGGHMTHEEKMAELKQIHALMKKGGVENLRKALDRMKEGKYLPKKKSPTE